jgi:hypothetical protein
MYVYLYACMHAYVHACMKAFMHAGMHTYIHACMHAYLHTCMHVYVECGALANNKNICERTHKHTDEGLILVGGPLSTVTCAPPPSTAENSSAHRRADMHTFCMQ